MGIVARRTEQLIRSNEEIGRFSDGLKVNYYFVTREKLELHSLKEGVARPPKFSFIFTILTSIPEVFSFRSFFLFLFIMYKVLPCVSWLIVYVGWPLYSPLPVMFVTSTVADMCGKTEGRRLRPLQMDKQYTRKIWQYLSKNIWKTVHLIVQTILLSRFILFRFNTHRQSEWRDTTTIYIYIYL